MKHTKHLLVLWAALLLGAGNAWGAEETLTISGASNGHNAPWSTSYGSGTGTSTTSASTSIGISYTNVGRMTTSIQIKAGTSNGFYSTSVPTNSVITSIKITSKTNSVNLYVSKDGSNWGSATKISSTTTKSYTTADGYKYFKVMATSKYAQITSIIITYESGTTEPTLYLGLFLAAFVAVRACVRRVECLYATFHHIIMSKIDFRSVYFAKECFVCFFCFCCSFLLLDQKKRTKEKSRLWRLRCQKFVVSVSAKSNSLRSDSDLAFRHAQLDF